MTEPVRSRLDDGVLTLTLNRPEKKNALTRAMYQALGDAIERAATDGDVRCILLEGEGDAFTAGNDLSDFAAINHESSNNVPRERPTNPFLNALLTTTLPVVAAVQGRAVGIGTTMLLHCDVVLVAEDARLSAPFANLALVPEAASSLLLPARIGHARAFSMFVLGETVDAATAVAWGLANTVCPRGELRDRARAAASAIASRPASAVRRTKTLMRDVAAYIARLNVETQHFTEQLASAEAREAFTAFAEKRAPDFTKLR